MTTPLKYMREEFKKLQWALYLVIIAFIVLIFVDWGSGRFSGSLQGDTVIQVGNRVISSREYYQLYRSEVEKYRSYFKDQFNEDLLKRLNLPMQVANQLIEDELLARQAEKAGINVSDEDVFNEIIQFPVFKDEAGNFIGKDKYERILMANQTTPSAFETDIRNNILVQKYQALLGEALVIPEDEIRTEYMKQNLSVTTDYLLVEDKTYESEILPSEEDIQAYYEKNKDEFRHPEKRKVTYLLADIIKIKPTIIVSDTDIKEYYDSHLDEYKQEEQVKARHILLKTENRSDEEALNLAKKVKKELEGGLSFEKAAGQYSEDPGSKDKGGDLGFFGRGRMVPAFENAAFTQPINTLSDPVKTNFGYHIIQVLEHKNEGYKTLEQVQSIIRDKIARARAEGKAETVAQDVYADLINRDSVTDDDLRSLADSNPDVTYNLTDPFSSKDVVPGIGRNEEFMNSVFNEDMDIGEISVPVKTSRGYAIARLELIVPEGISLLEDIRSDIVAKVKKEQAHFLVQAKLTEMTKANTALDGIGSALDLTVEKDKEIKYMASIPKLGKSREAHEILFSSEIGSLAGPIEFDNGWALFVVKNRDSMDQVDFEKQRPEIYQRLKQQEVAAYIRTTLESLKKDMKIFINQDYLSRFS